MAKKTVLQIVQDIMSDMSGDDITSINDTVESLQVAQIVQSCYEELMNRKDWPHLKTLLLLETAADTDFPTHMTVPEGVKKVLVVQYNKTVSGSSRNYFTDIKYVEPDDFLRRVAKYDNTLSTVDVITDPSGVTLNIKNNVMPEFYTSFNDEVLVFNAYDSAQEATLLAAKTALFVVKEPSITLADETIPSMPSEMFPALIAEAKSTAFTSIKQEDNAKAEQQSKRQTSVMNRNSWKVAGGIKLPNYGKRSVK